MADDSGIDPRYAAQFQRGFDPGVHAPEAIAKSAGPVRLAGGPVASAERVPDRPLPRSRPATPAPIEAAGVPAEDEVAEPRRLAPIEWALPALAAVLFVAAVWCLVEVLTPRDLFGGTDAVEQSLIQIQMALPGPLLVASTITASAWLVLRALRTTESR